MKPAFALSLSADGIQLLQKLQNGWYLLEEINPANPDLAGHMAHMQALAASLSPTGLRTKLIVPHDQIKYLTAPINATSQAQRLEQVQAALEGGTPYPLEELSYDWHMKGTDAQIAAVAHETLAEAEAFATDFNFAPVCFVGAPQNGEFGGEPFFGMSKAAGTLLPAGQTVERDTKPIVILGPVPSPSVDDERLSDVLEQAIQDEAVTASDTAPAPETKSEAAPETANVTAASVPEREDVPKVAFASRRDVSSELPAEPSLGTGRPLDKEPECRITFTPPAGKEVDAPETASAPQPFSVVQTPVAPAAIIDTAAAKPLGTPNRDFPQSAPAAPAAFAEGPAQAPIAPAITGLSPATQNAAPAAQFVPQRDDAIVDAELAAVPVEKPSAPNKLSNILASRKAKKDAKRQTQAVVEDEAEKFTVFGARKPAEVGGKPKFLGLILTGVLLLFLAIIALVSANWEGRAVSWLLGKDADTALAGTAAPVTSSEPVTLEVAATDIGLQDVVPAPATLSQPQKTPAINATDILASTGIWIESAERPVPTALENEVDDGLYLASIDPVVGVSDAVALPSATQLLPDAVYEGQKSPLGPEVTFTLNAQGLVVATPDGALAPEGFRVFAGKPSSIPPERPEREAQDIVQPIDPRVVGVRPKARPLGIFEKRQRDQLGGYTRIELASLRPNARPEGLVPVKPDPTSAQTAAAALAEANQQTASTAGLSQPDPDAASLIQPVKPDLSNATSRAVASSRIPKTRPKNFARTAARILKKSQENETRVVAVAPRTVKPTGKINGTVARNATLSNALNLRKVNLIGVYGKTSSRQAMVRLTNGRYVKVKAGDRLDGGRVAAIGASELRYVKKGRNIVLKMPRS